MVIDIILWLITVLCCIVIWSGKLSQRSRIIVVMVSIVSLIGTILRSDFIGISVIENIYNNNEDWLFVLFAMIGFVGFLIIPSIAVIPVIVLLFFLIENRQEKKLTVSILDESKLYPGGVLYFDVRFVGKMTMGYFTANITGAFDEYNIESKHYHTTKQCGTINQKNTNFGWKWNVPKDFTPGQCSITIKAKRTIKLFGFFTPINHTIKECELECIIEDISQNLEEKLYSYVDKKIKLVNEKIDLLEEKMNKKFDKLENKIEKIYEMILDEPVRTLKIRYAKGEITKEEFEGMKKDLQ